MPSRRYSSEILYPFTPDAEAHRDLVAGVLDAFFIVKGEGVAGPYDESSSSGSTIDTAWPVDKDYFGALYSLVVTSTTNTYVFYAKAPQDYWRVMTFTVTRGNGIIKVNDAETAESFIIVDSDALYDTTSTTTEMWTELEPSRLLFQLDEIRSIRLTNEYREHDTRIRSSVLDERADETVLYLDQDADTLQLVDGYNCSLSYDDTTGVLTISGGPGLGEGKPKEFPWDSVAPDVFTGIKSVNGVNVDGNLPVEFKESVLPVYTAGALTMQVREG